MQTIRADARFARLEALIEKTEAAISIACDAPMNDDTAPAEARAADEALRAYVSAVAAIRPQSLTDMALQARAAHYWHERSADLAKVRDSDRQLVQSVLDAAGIEPRSFIAQPIRHEHAMDASSQRAA
jgi:hypothetical protein